MLGFLQNFAHKSEMRESKDEMLLGEIVRAMARQGHPAVAFRAGNDRQTVRFKCVSDPLLHSVFVILDRRTGSGALSAAILGSKATLRITAEVKNRIADPDEIKGLALYLASPASAYVTGAQMTIDGGSSLRG